MMKEAEVVKMNALSSVQQVLDQFQMTPLNVTIQAAVGENQMMSLVMSVHPGLEDDPAINARIDRMIALMERQKKRASIPVLEAQLAERLEIRKKVILQADRFDRQFEEQNAERVKCLLVARQEFDRAMAEQQAAWEESDGRRPFDPRNARVAKVIMPLSNAVAKLTDDIEKARVEIDAAKQDHQRNLIQCDEEIAKLEEKIKEIQSSLE